jgi:hypothetical protein
MPVKFIKHACIDQLNIITNDSYITLYGLRNRQFHCFRGVYFKDNPGEEQEGLLLYC